MGSDELIANEFRIMLAKQKIQNENIKGEKNANDAHYKVGTIVRNSIKEAGGTMPEELPTPEKSLKEIKKEELKKINGGSTYLYLDKIKANILLKENRFIAFFKINNFIFTN